MTTDYHHLQNLHYSSMLSVGWITGAVAWQVGTNNWASLIAIYMGCLPISPSLYQKITLWESVSLRVHWEEYSAGSWITQCILSKLPCEKKYRMDWQVGEMSLTDVVYLWSNWKEVSEWKFSENLYFLSWDWTNNTSALSLELWAWLGPVSSAKHEGYKKAVRALGLHSP
jgi:hypothetical protein